jgi:hypothetical protein
MGLCFMADGRRIVVADCGGDRVCVFSSDGAFLRHIGVGVLHRPQGVACSAFDELIVADTGNHCVRIFSDVGDLLVTFGDGVFTGVATRGSVVFGQDKRGGAVRDVELRDLLSIVAPSSGRAASASSMSDVLEATRM